MSDIIQVPKATAETTKESGPAWFPVKNSKGELRRPYIQCKCGSMLACGNHHIHPDGRVTLSWHHAEQMPGCGWHVHIQLMDWDGSEWLPGRTEAEEEKDFE